MPWEFWAIKIIWKKSHYLTYQQVHSWCCDDVSSVNHTWLEKAEWLKLVVTVIKRHFHMTIISFLKNVYFWGGTNEIRTLSWRPLMILSFSGLWEQQCSTLVWELCDQLWEVMVCFKTSTMRLLICFWMCRPSSEGEKCELVVWHCLLILAAPWV